MNGSLKFQVSVERFLYGFSLFIDCFHVWERFVFYPFLETNKLTFYWFIDLRPANDIKTISRDYPDWFVDTFILF